MRQRLERVILQQARPHGPPVEHQQINHRRITAQQSLARLARHGLGPLAHPSPLGADAERERVVDQFKMRGQRESSVASVH